MQFISHSATSLSCLEATGNVRSIASKIAFGASIVRGALKAHADQLPTSVHVPGRVYSCGSWKHDESHAQLAAALGRTLGPALRPNFEWYCCRGAFFHNDAHYEARLFGTWIIAGPAHDLVFPRTGVRLPSAPDNITVFDPFEVHGIVLPQTAVFEPADYADTEPTVILGFELDLTPAIANAFGITQEVAERVISSA